MHNATLYIVFISLVKRSSWEIILESKCVKVKPNVLNLSESALNSPKKSELIQNMFDLKGKVRYCWCYWCCRLAFGSQRFPVRVRRLQAICRGELSAVIARLMSKCLWSGWKWGIKEMPSAFPCSPLICQFSWKKTQIDRKKSCFQVSKLTEVIYQISLENRNLKSELVITQNVNSRLEKKIIHSEKKSGERGAV